MTYVITTLVAATLSAVGFSILFSALPKRLPFIALASFVTWGAYLLAALLFDDYLMPNIIAALIAGLFSEVFARILKAPATVFLIPSIIPLVPGGRLYYSMHYFIMKDYTQALSNVYATIITALGISGGIMIASLISGFFKKPCKNPNNNQ